MGDEPLRVLTATEREALDQRARDILDATYAIHAELPELVKAPRDREITSQLETVLETMSASWQAEELREILMKHKRTRARLVELAPEAKTTRSFGGGGGRRLMAPWSV